MYILLFIGIITMDSTTNPLFKHFRQPVVYLKLPSGGSFWPDGSLDLPLNGELGILAMSTKDEIILKTPDALLNGQGVVDVIQSCCPSIKDAWQTPSIDVDALIIAIRIASYGNEMEFTSECPHCKNENEYNIDLSKVLAGITAPDYSKKLEIDNLKIKLKPQPYFSSNHSNKLLFEERQLIRTLAHMENNAEDIKPIFNQQLSRIIDLNMLLYVNSTDYIELEDNTIVHNSEYIRDFYTNCNSEITRKLKEHLDSMADIANIKPVDVICNNEECKKPFSINITYDYASFFGKGS